MNLGLIFVISQMMKKMKMMYIALEKLCWRRTSQIQMLIVAEDAALFVLSKWEAAKKLWFW